MAYGKLAEGNEVWLSAKNGSVNFEDMNELQSQLKGMLGPRDLLLFPAGYEGQITGWEWDNTFDYLEAATNDNAVWIVPIPVYAGQKLTEVEVQVTGTNASTGGALYFAEKIRGGTTVTSEQIDSGGNVYRCASGVAYANVVTYTKSLSITCQADRYYFLWLEAGSDASTEDCRIWWYHVKAQFGN